MTLVQYPTNFNINVTPQEKKEELAKLSISAAEIIDNFFSDQVEFAPKLEINNRLSSTNGRYHSKENKIDISGRLAKASRVSNDYDHITKVLKHELAHWFLHKKGRNFHDGDKEFEELLKWIDSFSSGTTNKKLQLAPSMPIFGFSHVMLCEKCGKEIISNQKVGKSKMHRDCGGGFKFVGYTFIGKGDC